MYYRVNTAGLYVYSVENDSTAAKAGFKPGDLIISVDGTKVETQEEYDKILESHAVGDTIEVVVSRRDEEHKLSLELTEYSPVSGSMLSA